MVETIVTSTRTRLRLAYFVPPSRHFAGIERVVHEIASGMVERYGDVLDVHVLFASDYDEPLLASTRYVRHVLGVDRLRGLAIALRRRVAAEDVDILVCPQIEASVIAWIATRGLRLPYFVPHLHGNPRLEEADGTRRTRAAFALFRRVVAARSAGVLAVSPSLARYAATELAPTREVAFARNPVRAMGTKLREPSTDDARFHLLCVGRLSRQKGQDILLRALALARADLPPVTLTLVGSGPEEASLQEACTRLGLDDVVEFIGYTSEPEAYFRAADCLVLPSRWEGFGVVLVEALQTGLPLLAADCDFGPADVITDARIGELVAPNDEHALAEGLKRAAARGCDGEGEVFRREAAKSYGPGEAVRSQYDALRRFVPLLPGR
ncbi:glycosyltransferase [Actinomycetospora rhizophila]|uniref:Glycosyltransferase n=1 Tax=Actinomycetospora rhizophila TaxID=1416876 RepID=A0ABV9ZND2_9PSEU